LEKYFPAENKEIVDNQGMNLIKKYSNTYLEKIFPS